jgi:oligopeptide transport system substrate-binding protein
MRLPSLVLVLVSVLLLAGCSRSGAPAAAAAKILAYGNGAEPEDLDPHIVTGVSENNIITALFEGLVNYHPSGEGISPGVAESWETAPDGLTWTFHLRSTARWSNGEPVTSRDFLRSYQRILTPTMAAKYARNLFHVVGAEDFNSGKITDFAATGFSAPDAHTLVLHLNHPVPYLLELLKHYSWFPVHLPTIEKFGPADRKGNAWTRAGNLVGNGPFQLESWLPNQKITVTRSPTYWNAPAVKLDGIAFYAIDSIDAEERMFRGGQLDVTSTIPTSKIDEYRSKSPGLMRIDPYYGTYFYRLNTTRPPLNDARVRRALALSFDREAIIKTILRAGQTAAYNITPAYAGFTPDTELKSDLIEARRLLAEAGFPEGKGMRPIELLYNTSEGHKQIAEAIQQMWRTNLGIDISLRNEEWKVYLDSQHNLNFDISRAAWIGDYPNPETFLDLWITDGGNNDTGYANPAYDHLLATALATAGAAERLAVYRQMENLIVRDVPVIPVYFYKRVFLINPRVQNWVPNILDNRGWQYIDISPAPPDGAAKTKT